MSWLIHTSMQFWKSNRLQSLKAGHETNNKKQKHGYSKTKFVFITKWCWSNPLQWNLKYFKSDWGGRGEIYKKIVVASKIILRFCLKN